MHIGDPLLWAILYGISDMDILLLDHGAGTLNSCRDYTLHTAAQFGDKAMVEILLNRGANTNRRNNWGETALHQGDYNRQGAR